MSEAEGIVVTGLAEQGEPEGDDVPDGELPPVDEAVRHPPRPDTPEPERTRPAASRPRPARSANNHSRLLSLDLNELDRDLTEPERHEWNDIYASFRSKSVLTVGPNRCLIECGGMDLTLRYQDISYSSCDNLRKQYRPGEHHDCILKEYDRASIKEAASNPFEGAIVHHPLGCRRQREIRRRGVLHHAGRHHLPAHFVCLEKMGDL
jgi:hypothetical protein